jgi:hypothetical protein
VAPASNLYSVSGSVSLPADTSATITAKISPAVNLAELQAVLLSQTEQEIVTPVNLDNVGGFSFQSVPTGTFYRITILTKKKTVILQKLIDSLDENKASLVVDVETTGIAVLAKKSSFQKGEEAFKLGISQGKIDLTDTKKAIQDWLMGISYPDSTTPESVLDRALGNTEIQKIIGSTPTSGTDTPPTLPTGTTPTATSTPTVPATTTPTLPSANKPPVITLVKPQMGENFKFNTTAIFEVVATDTDGRVVKVEFFVSNQKIGESLSEPFSLSWVATQSGNLAFFAKATDDSGNVQQTPTIYFSVTANSPPIVAIISPTATSTATGIVFDEGAEITLIASATDPDGVVTKVEFFANQTEKIGEATASPFSCKWTGAKAGKFSIQAKATDDIGSTSSSTLLSITINARPTVKIASPSVGSEAPAGGEITFAIDSSDSDGNVVKVELFSGNEKIGESESDIKKVIWKTPQPGDYKITALAIDNLGGRSNFSNQFTIKIWATTKVSGIISTSQTWSVVNSPYELSGKCQVANGATLTIEPGVKVFGNNQELEIFGILSAIGNPSNRIYFLKTRLKPGSQDQSNLFFIDLSYLDVASGAIYPPNGNATYGSINLRNSIIRDTDYMHLWYPKKDCYIEGNIFLNSGDISVGTSDNVKVFIQNNAFYGQTGASGKMSAISVWASIANSQTVVRYNSFLSNDRIALRLPSGFTGAKLSAIENYWNTTSTDVINSMIYDKNDDLSSPDFITFEPILSNPHSATPDPTPYL